MRRTGASCGWRSFRAADSRPILDRRGLLGARRCALWCVESARSWRAGCHKAWLAGSVRDRVNRLFGLRTGRDMEAALGHGAGTPNIHPSY